MVVKNTYTFFFTKTNFIHFFSGSGLALSHWASKLGQRWMGRWRPRIIDKKLREIVKKIREITRKKKEKTCARVRISKQSPIFLTYYQKSYTKKKISWNHKKLWKWTSNLAMDFMQKIIRKEKYSKKIPFFSFNFLREIILLLVEQDICKQTAEECKQCYQPYLFENGQKKLWNLPNLWKMPIFD